MSDNENVGEGEYNPTDDDLRALIADPPSRGYWSAALAGLVLRERAEVERLMAWDADVVKQWRERAEKAEAQVEAVMLLADHFERHYGPSLGCEIRNALNGAVTTGCTCVGGRQRFHNRDCPVYVGCDSTAGSLLCDMPAGHPGGHSDGTGYRWPQ